MSDKTLLSNIFPVLCAEYLDATREILHRLAQRPPQVLLFDGGSEGERRDMARYWACCTMCEESHSGVPCLTCATCEKIASDACFDIMAYDGYIGEKEDEDSPGFFRAFTAENSRNVKVRLRDSPRGRYHIVFFTGIAASSPEAPNALLKLLEEPSKTSLFVLLVPQREQILPTLVSRSLCLTLPWPDPLLEEDKEISDLLNSFVGFFSDTGNFLSVIAEKSFMSQPLAVSFFIACQKSVIRVLAGRPKHALDKVFATLSPQSIQNIIVWLQESAQMVRNAKTPVSPVRVVEAFAMHVYLLFGKNPKR